MARKAKLKSPPSDIDEDEFLVEPAEAIDPYKILSIDTNATKDQIKSAYRKAALKYHPDKVKPEGQNEAHAKFQEIATAYAILIDEKRRRRYDTTGNTSESLDDDDFSWTDFFREQSEAVVNGDMIEQIKKEYQGSEEERQDVIQAYKDSEGDMDIVYEVIMCSNVCNDDQRFRQYIDDVIKCGKAQRYAKYTTEGRNKQRKRIKKAKAEAAEAMDLAEQLGVKEKLFGKDSGGTKQKGNAANDDTLKALIQQRQKVRSENFLDELEARYSGGKKSKRKAQDEPPEELFQKNARRSNSRK